MALESHSRIAAGYSPLAQEFITSNDYKMAFEGLLICARDERIVCDSFKDLINFIKLVGKCLTNCVKAKGSYYEDIASGAYALTLTDGGFTYRVQATQEYVLMLKTSISEENRIVTSIIMPIARGESLFNFAQFSAGEMQNGDWKFYKPHKMETDPDFNAEIRSGYIDILTRYISDLAVLLPNPTPRPSVPEVFQKAFPNWD